MAALKSMPLSPIAVSTDHNAKNVLMVSSHERSGTHFLMNTIAENCFFSINPYVNFDTAPVGAILNFHSGKLVGDFFSGLWRNNCASIVKSHFPSEFFKQDENLICSEFIRILYVYRRPLDVFRSYKQFIDHLPWHEGPTTQELKDFVLHEPEGQMLRYQRQQKASLLQRWEDHVTGWLELERRYPKNIKCIRYENLNGDFENTTRSLLEFLKIAPPAQIRRPERGKNTIDIPNAPVAELELESCDSVIRENIKSPMLKALFYPG